MASKSTLAKSCSFAVYPGFLTLVVLVPIVVSSSIWAASIPWLPHYFGLSPRRFQNVPINARDIFSRCMSLSSIPGPPEDFRSREVSDRYEPGTKATLIKNATIFTGEEGGSVVTYGSIFLEKGIIKHVGKVPPDLLQTDSSIEVVDARGAWVTPGLVDLHSHLGLLSAPFAGGALDVNSRNGPILPWLRSIDAFNTHDEAFQLAIAGGVTSAQILPGSGNAIGGQAFMVKLRKTSEGSPSSMVIEPPHELLGKDPNPDKLNWRYLKQACGENLKRYGTRMDSVWALRSAYNEARNMKKAQDAFCAKVKAGQWESSGSGFPEDPKWEVLVDVLRGRVKISNHCYEAVDLDAMVRLTNEFKFHINSFHHASEAWLVPGLLNKTWGGKPGLALFATNHRYKRESFRGSEYASRVLSDAGFPVIMKSQHPVMNSRYLLFEAQQAHYFGLPHNTSLAAVTSTPAKLAGLSHRIGILREGADADVVLWDSHPLQLAATPIKVWIDGIPQIPLPSKSGEPTEVVVGKGKEGEEWRHVPEVPNWDKERKAAIDWDGLPPLQGRTRKDRIVFANVTQVWMPSLAGGVLETFSSSQNDGEMATVVVENGKITCVNTVCLGATSVENLDVIDLRGGSISPGLMSYGSPLGLEEIAGEPSTGDGKLLDAFTSNTPDILDDSGAIVRAMDALMFGTRNALTAYRSGVTLATASLIKAFSLNDLNTPVISGLSVTFRTGGAHALERGAIIQDIVALHVNIAREHPFSGRGVGVSTQIAGLKRLLYGWESKEKETGRWFRKAAEGVIPLVIEVESADIMASLLIVKAEVENTIGSRMRMVFSGATEAHLLAESIANAGVGVILTQARPFPAAWSQRRVLPGPPLTNDTALVRLMQHGVTVGLGVREAWEARHTRFDIRWAALESNGRIEDQDMYALAYDNLQKLLGIRELDDSREAIDLVAYEGGGVFDFSSKVVAVISSEKQSVDCF